MIYPDIETLRRDSESFEAMPEFRCGSQLERNCNQIFVKGPGLTRDFLEKVNADIVPKKTYLFGYELNTKKILFVCGLFLLFFTSLFGAVLMWFTDLFDNTVLSTMVISNSSKYFSMWKNPPVKILVSVHIFNYTNLEEFDSRMEQKLRVQEIGPYVYEEIVERINVSFSDDGNSVTFREKRSYNFRADLSKGIQSDQVTVPNIAFLGATSMTKYSGYFTRLGLSSFATGIDERPFVTVSAQNFTIGYRNRLLSLSNLWSELTTEDAQGIENIGLLAEKVGAQPYVFTMNTGKSDINKLGLIEKLNGKEHFNYWSTNACDSVSGADGALYSAKLVRSKQRLRSLVPQMCRSVPFLFQKEDNILNGKVPSYRYIVPDDFYQTVQENPENQCYCDLASGTCSLKGVFNITACAFGAPMFISKPHLLGADESLLKGVDGLRTFEEKNAENYLHIHPTMGFAMTGRAVFQMNIQVQKAFGVHQLDRLEDGTMLPMAWLQFDLKEEDLPQTFLDIIYDATYTLKGVKLAFKYGFLLTTLITFVCIVLVFKNVWEKPHRVRVSCRRGEQRSEAVEL